MGEFPPDNGKRGEPNIPNVANRAEKEFNCGDTGLCCGRATAKVVHLNLCHCALGHILVNRTLDGSVIEFPHQIELDLPDAQRIIRDCEGHYGHFQDAHTKTQRRQGKFGLFPVNWQWRPCQSCGKCRAFLSRKSTSSAPLEIPS